MNKTLLLAAMAATMGISSVVSATGYAPTGYNGVGGAAASSAAHVSGNTVTGGNGFQTSGASAANVTSAGVTNTYTPNGVVVNAHTASVGDTSTFSFGRGKGTTSAGAIQGGKANANTTAHVGDRDYHSGHRHTSYRNFDWDKTSASGRGHVTIDSSVAQGSIAVSKVTNKGQSDQWSGAGATNETSGYVTVNADARHNKAAVDLTAGTASQGDTFAYGYGKTKHNGTGFSGGAAKQDGNAWSGARGRISINKGTGHHHYYGRDHKTTTDSGNGYAKVNSDASVETKSIAGGINTHKGETYAWSSAGNESTAGVKQRFKNNGVKQKTYATSETGALAGGWKVGQGYSSFYADGKGTGFAKGKFNGDVDVSHSYSNPVQNGCVANGGAGNCGLGNGLGGGNGTGNEGNGNGPV